MTAIAKENQSITTESFVQRLSGGTKSRTRLFDSTRVKGINEEIKIYQLLWEEGNVTTFATAHHLQQIYKATISIVLRFNGEERCYTDGDMASTISIGRDGNCDMSVDAKYASRSHAKLEFRRGKFVLLDHSTNGTYVKLENQHDIFLRREELPLIGEGYISLGEEYKKENTTNIYFSVRQQSRFFCLHQRQTRGDSSINTT